MLKYRNLSNIKKKSHKASANLLLIFILMKLLLLTILIQLDQIFLYKKIFTNEQNLYHTQQTMELKLQELVEIYKNKPNNNPINTNFLPDELSINCSSGLNVYQENIDNKLKAYIGIRTQLESNKPLTNQLETLFDNLFLYPTANNAHSITLIDLTSNNELEVLFLDQKNSLWKYNYIKNSLTILNNNIAIIDYIVGASFFAAKYNIYIRYKTINNIQDQISAIIVDYKDNILISELINLSEAIKFFLRTNHLIFLYQNSEPQVYKLIYNNKLLVKKIKVNFNYYEQPAFNCSQAATLNWISSKQIHKAAIINTNCIEQIYEFSLPQDNSILSIYYY